MFCSTPMSVFCGYQEARTDAAQLVKQARAIAMRALEVSIKCDGDGPPSEATRQVEALARVAGAVLTAVLDVSGKPTEIAVVDDAELTAAKDADAPANRRPVEPDTFAQEQQLDLEIAEAVKPVVSLEIDAPEATAERRASLDEALAAVQGAKRRTALALVLAMVFFAVVVVPLLVLVLCAVFGFVISRCEGWAFSVGFLYFAGNVTGLGNPLTDHSPKSPAGTYIDVIVSCWILIFAGAAVGATAELQLVEKLQDNLPLEGWKGLVVLLILVPGFVMFAAFAIGALLAVIEDWRVSIGFRYMISAMCGLGNPLTESKPESAVGRLVAIVCASWQMAIGGTVVGLAGAIPSLESALRSMEHLFIKCTGGATREQKERVAEAQATG